ncbi:uncharacterized protein LOC134819655 isoform X2 [Bolinopsis microptera]|uniref:uncharacterized protein LOC134819655 isoform X2 n=1 Tax=Bolinopsis microptera TaxID=2820187 RepID=UPI003079ECB7
MEVGDHGHETVCPQSQDLHASNNWRTLCFICLFVLTADSVILYVIYGVKHRSLRWSLDYLVSFLAITDLVSTLVGVPIPIIAYMQGFWPGSCTSGANQSFSTFNITCKLFYLFLVWGRLSTMFIITMMCIERFLAITRPFVHREIVTAGRLRKCVYGIWTSMFVYSLLPILNIGHVKLHWNVHLDAGETTTSSDPPYFFCFMDYSDLDVKQSSGLGNLIYSIIFVLFGCISLTIVITCVFFICRILLVRRPRFNATSSKKPTSASKTYSVKAPDATDEDQNTVKNKVVGKPSILDKSKSFLAKRRPQIKKFEPEELQFIALMLMIAGVFYITFLPTMVLVISNIAGHGLSENFTFWSMRLTSFIVVVNPLIYGLSNKIYRVGCLYVLKSCAGFFCCKKIPVPERLGPRKLISTRHRLTPVEKAAQDFIIAASHNKGEAIAKTFVGKMKVGVEGRRLETLIESSKEQEHCPPQPRRSVVNFRTGTYLRETSQDLKHADLFFNSLNFNFSGSAFSFRVPTKPKPRSLKQSNSSPATGSSTESLMVCNGKQQPDSLILNNLIATQTSLYVATGKYQETFFGVVSEAAKLAGLGSTVFVNHQTSPVSRNHHTSSLSDVEPGFVEKQPAPTKGYLRKGLREKLALKAEQARLQVQKLERMASKEEETVNEGVNVDSGVGSDTLGGTDSFESVGTGCGPDVDHGGDSDQDII